MNINKRGLTGKVKENNNKSMLIHVKVWSLLQRMLARCARVVKTLSHMHKQKVHESSLYGHVTMGTCSLGFLLIVVYKTKTMIILGRCH